MAENDIETASVKKSKKPLYISLALVAALVLSYFLVPEVQNFFNEAWNVLTSDDQERIRNWVNNFGWFGPVILILTMVAQMFLLVIPSVLLMVVSILAYGPVWGSIIVFAAVFAASSVGYFIGRYFGPVLVERVIGHRSEKKVADFLDDYGFWAVFITRFNPFLSNDAISFVAGVLKMGYWKFIGATLAGIAPLIGFIAVIGRSTEGLKTGLLWGSVISLILFGLYIWWDRKKRKKKQ
ncbi:TVP38/TMEM64 family protein [Zunongwangia sp. H14]|uniref:TVP38/TMEM64 family protein n=1 Tax=Zunongwangia sp. H14 TaxID=3240792 RepID=UPI003562F2A0